MKEGEHPNEHVVRSGFEPQDETPGGAQEVVVREPDALGPAGRAGRVK